MTMEPIKLTREINGQVGDYLFINNDGQPAVISADQAEFVMSLTTVNAKEQKERQQRREAAASIQTNNKKGRGGKALPKILKRRRRPTARRLALLEAIFQNFGSGHFTFNEFLNMQSTGELSLHRSAFYELEGLGWIMTEDRDPTKKRAEPRAFREGPTSYQYRITDEGMAIITRNAPPMTQAGDATTSYPTTGTAFSR